MRRELLGYFVFVAGNKVGPDLAIVTVAESKRLIHRSQTRARCETVQAEISAAKLPRPLNRPTQKGRGRAGAGVLSANRETMNVRRFLRQRVGPEGDIFELKSHCAGGILSVLCEEIKSRGNISDNARGIQLVRPPHRHARLLEPLSSLRENIRNQLGVLRRCLSNLHGVHWAVWARFRASSGAAWKIYN